MEDAARLVAARPIPREEMEVLAAVFFPDPDWPTRPAAGNGHGVEGETAFWESFSGGRALPAGSRR